MHDFIKGGRFPAPHSGVLSKPEFLQQLYAKINECVTAVNECITLVDTSNNVVENWNTLKAECDMVMMQYADTMNEYDNTMGDYTSQLEGLENRLTDLNTATSTLETLIEGYKTEVDQKAEEALSEINVLVDSIVEIGTSNGWNWRKYKSGRVTAVKELTIEPNGKVQYVGDGVYFLDYDVEFPFPLATGRYLWLQPGYYSRTTAYVISSTKNLATIRLENPTSSWSDTETLDVLCLLEGIT